MVNEPSVFKISRFDCINLTFLYISESLRFSFWGQYMYRKGHMTSTIASVSIVILQKRKLKGEAKIIKIGQ